MKYIHTYVVFFFRSSPWLFEINEQVKKSTHTYVLDEFDTTLIEISWKRYVWNTKRINNFYSRSTDPINFDTVFFKDENKRRIFLGLLILEVLQVIQKLHFSPSDLATLRPRKRSTPRAADHSVSVVSSNELVLVVYTKIWGLLRKLFTHAWQVFADSDSILLTQF